MTQTQPDVETASLAQELAAVRSELAALQRSVAESQARPDWGEAAEDAASRERRFRAAIDASPVPMAMNDERQRITFLNPAFVQTFGYRLEDIPTLEHWWSQAYPDPDYRQSVSDAWGAELARVKRTGTAFVPQEARVLCKDGATRVILANAAPFADSFAGNHMVVLHDITDRKLAESALQRSERALQNSQRVAHLGSWAWDVQTNRAEWSDEMFRLFGLERAGFTGDVVAVVTQAIHPDDRPAAEGFSRWARGMGDKAFFECRLCRPDGTVRLVRIEAGELERDAAGRPRVLTGIVLDITDRKRAEEVQRQSERFFLDIFENNPVPQLSIDPQSGRIVEANSAACRFYGYSRDALTAQHIWDLNSLGEDETRQTMARCVVGQQTEFEFRHRLASGEIRDVRVFSHPVQAGGRLLLHSIVFDIADRKRAEDERRKLSWAVEQSPASIVITDRAGDIEYVNRRFELVTGYARAEVLGLNPRFLKSGTTPATTYAEMWRVISAGGEWSGEICNRRKSGELFWEFVAISGVKDEAGQIAHYVAVKEDISTRKQADERRASVEAEALQAQKMELVGRLAGGVAHDFNNMLGVILGHTELVMEQVDPAAALREHLDEIHDAAMRSAALTRQLLAFARKQPASPRVLDLNNTVQGMVKMLQRLIGENVRLSLLFGQSLGSVKVDPSQVDQILANLCINGRDAIPGVGQITIETDNHSLDSEYCAAHPGSAPGEYVRLAVSDDGRGMDEPVLAHIFEPFFTTKSMGQGTGLGLATVYGIVKQNRGYIDVRSAVGRGTTFTIYLPRHRVAGDVARRPEPMAQSVSGRETILLVEDELTILKLAGRILAQLGYTVLSANTPTDALRLAREHRGELHLIVTDVIMPEMNGHDLAQQLLPHHPTMKCLFMSGYTSDIIANHGVLDDGVNFVQKPFSRQALAAKVREVLDSTAVS